MESDPTFRSSTYARNVRTCIRIHIDTYVRREAASVVSHTHTPVYNIYIYIHTHKQTHMDTYVRREAARVVSHDISLKDVLMSAYTHTMSICTHIHRPRAYVRIHKHEEHMYTYIHTNIHTSCAGHPLCHDSVGHDRRWSKIRHNPRRGLRQQCSISICCLLVHR
jgi:hypothetical protein